MAIVDPNTLKIGDTVRFRTLNPHDNVYHTGKIRSICDYETAKLFDDVDVYYQEVLRYQPAIGDKTTLTYLLINIAENNAVSVTRVFALEMIDKGSLERVELNSYVDIRVYDIDTTKAQDVLNAIKTLGYTCNIVTS